MTVSSDLTAEASAAFSTWLHDHPAASAELREAMRAHIHLQELPRKAAADHATWVAALERAVRAFFPGL
jgi:hypothetical protein